MRKYILLLVISVLTSQLLIGCGSDPLKIGYAGSLTGSNSELGVNGMYGAQLAVDEINASGGIKGKKIELITKDDKGNKKTALEADREMIKEGCIAIVGHMTSDMAEMLVPYINEQKILMISPTMAIASLSDKDDYFLRLIPTTKQQAVALAGQIKKLDIADVLILYSNENAAFAECLTANLVSILDKSDIQSEKLEKFEFSTPADYRDTASMIGNSKVDGVVIIASADIVSDLSQAMRNAGADNGKTVFLPAWSMTNDLLAHGGNAVEGFYGVSFIDYESKERKYLDFRQKYKKKYEYEPTFASILSYESVMVLAEAMKGSGAMDTDRLKQYIMNKKVFDGLQGEFTINRYGDTDRQIFLYQIRNNKFSRVVE